MNTGIQDAYNLAWKLALVDAGVGRPALLESYHEERHPVARALLTETDMGTRVSLWRSRAGREAFGALMKLLTGLRPVRRRMVASAMEISVAYPNSPIVGEHRASVLDASLAHDDQSENPSLADFREFSAAPEPGERAPDVDLVEGGLYDLLRGTAHDLLLFDGMAPTPEGYANLSSIARSVRERWGEHIRVHTVVPMADPPALVASDPSLILDPDRALHARYGGSAECLYLVRPDGYVGFRAQPADGAKLLEHLQTYLA